MLSNQEESTILYKTLCFDCLPIRQNQEGINYFLATLYVPRVAFEEQCLAAPKSAVAQGILKRSNLARLNHSEGLIPRP
jgi:hypothetical protein